MDVETVSRLDDLSCFTYDTATEISKPGPSKRSYAGHLSSIPKKPRLDDLTDLRSDNVDQQDAVFTDSEDDNFVVEEPVVKYRRVLRNRPNIPHIGVTTSDGGRVYLRLLDQGLGDDAVGETTKKSVDLLSVGFYQLREQASQSRNKFHETMADVLNIEDMGSLGVLGTDLWVEKYRPKSYMDLLSEEALNHNLLHWLKLWDKTVFGKDYLAKHKELKGKYASLEEKEKEKFYYNQVAHAEDDAYDELGRPKQKIALLHGPPGFGKTTCAHVIAKHAGYKVVELNASDDRSAEIFRKTLDCSTQMRPEVFQDGRPNCLIIDEIDGAPGDAINVLVDYITGKATEKGKAKNKKILRRPIICICNDLFAPALKNLKPYSYVMKFQPVSVNALVDRMKSISIKEKLNMDSTSLHTLCERTECDLRSCLSSLQFLTKCKSGSDIKSILNKISRPDKSKGIFSVWDEIFFLAQQKKNIDGDDTSKPSTRFHKILRSVSSFGDYGKLFIGFFQNYPQVKLRDSSMKSISSGLQWCQWFDEIQAKIDRSQNYSLFPYLPMFFVDAHFRFATRNTFKLSYPSLEHISKTTRSRQVINSLLADISPNVGKFVSENVLVLDIIPNLMVVIQPGTIRPVAVQLWTTRERETVSNVVATMISYNLCYSQTRQPDGTYAFTIDPNIEEVGRFNLKDVSRPHFPYTVKQLVAREISMEKLRRNDFEKPESLPVKPMPRGPSASSLPNSMEVDDETQKRRSFSRQSSSADVLKISPSTAAKQQVRTTVQPKDFFGRPIVRTEKAAARIEEKREEIWYKFKEGYSNAVRKNLKLKDFL